MFVPELIQRKRDNGHLSHEEIAYLLAGYTDGSIPDYQMSALLMAFFFRGMDDAELTSWAGEMLRSGEVLDFSDIPAPKADKHSTGGVGDKISLILAPLVASTGVAVPMISVPMISLLSGSGCMSEPSGIEATAAGQRQRRRRRQHH